MKILLKSVSENIFNYFIPPDIIRNFRLAPENYGDSLFIHPPLYIIVCLLLKNLFGVSLPGVSLVLHVITALMIPSLACQICTFLGVNSSAVDIDTLSLLAVVIYCFCPIVSFATQKVWIDNAAVMTTTFCAVFHLSCMNYCRKKFTKLSVINNPQAVNSLMSDSLNHERSELSDLRQLFCPKMNCWTPNVIYFFSGFAFG